MLINFSVKNFRSIKEEITLSFEATNSLELEDYYIIEPKPNLRLLKLGIIYGSNASGKTTILRAIKFIRDLTIDPLDKKTDSLNFQPFLFDTKTSKENSHFSIEFIQNEVKYLYKLELNNDAIISEELFFFNPNKALVFKRSTDSSKQVSKIIFGSKIKINKRHKSTLEANTLWNNTVLGGYLKTNFDSHELQETTDWFEEKLKALITPKTNLLGYISSKLESEEINKNQIVDLLKKADFNISDIIIKKEENDVDSEFIEFLSNKTIISEERLSKIKDTGKIESKEIHFKHSIDKTNTEYSLPYKDESQGTQRYYQFSGLLDLMFNNETIFSIDELESSLHPDLLKHFLLTFLANSKKSQLIATSHHRELLMDRDIFRNDAIWFTEKNEDGSTELFSLEDFDSSIIRNTSSIFNAYKTGKLGAVPNLSDYYMDLEDGKK